MNTCFKVFVSYNILQYMCEFYLCFYIRNCLKMPKSPKLTNIVISTFTSKFLTTFLITYTREQQYIFSFMYTMYPNTSNITPFYTHFIPIPVSKKQAFWDPDPTLISFLRYKYNICIYIPSVCPL